MSAGKVYLVGGGCGDAELVTLKAIKALQKCDTVVYDSLVSEELLQWTRSDCERIYVGKRYQCHSKGQLEINALLIKKAREGKTVVRLKGGDPYVFGRGGEEFIALRDAGIRCEVIPGITSAIAVPTAAGIPVTHRGLSDSVTVVTGTAAKTGGGEELQLDFHTLAQLKGTLVILMGMHHLAEIVVGLLAAGKDRLTPCAVIMEGTTERQKVVRAPLFELPARAADRGITSPAVIVVGAVAKLELIMAGEGKTEAERETFIHFEKTETNGAERKGKKTAEAEGKESYGAESGRKAADCMEKGVYDMPLSGITVGVTGTAHFADRLSGVLREKGAQPWDMQFMEIMPTQEPLPDFTDYGWLVFTSPNGVRVFLDKMRWERRDLRMLADKKIAVIGPGTALALQEAGIYEDYMPQVYDAAHLAGGLADMLTAGRAQVGYDGTEACRDAGKKCAGGDEEGGSAEATGTGGKCRRMDSVRHSVLLLRAKQGSDILPYTFRKRGIPYAEYPLYELGVQEEKRDAVITKEPDYLVFGSAMGAKAYFEEMERRGARNTKSRYVCIGEQCAKEVRKYVTDPPLIAEKADVGAIVDCLCNAVAYSRKEEKPCIDSED